MDSSAALDILEQAEEHLAAGRTESALNLVNTLYGEAMSSSDRGRALALQAVCLEQLERGDEADRLIADVMNEEGDDLAFVRAAGMAFSDFNAFIHAEIFLRNLCELEPENPIAWFNLAIALGREGRYPESIKMYDECIRRNPEFADAYIQKAYCFELMDDLDQAAATYRGYLQQEPEDAEAWKALGIVESDRREVDAAYAAFEKAASIGDDPTDVYFNWAITAVRQNDLEQIEQCIAKMQAADPEDWRTLLTQADYEEAQDNIWPAWEAVCEAFDAVFEESEDFESSGYVAAALIHFAVRNDMGVHVGERIDRIFEEGLYSEDVLQALLTLDGRLSNAAKSHQVVLKASADAPEEEGDAHRFVVYGVSAENAAEAGDIAIEFESKYGAGTWEIYSLQEITGPDEGQVGVYWRSEETTRPPTPR
ncbi:MAG: tetratricopeptide repeat protein [Candidatus Hydrogenedentes bacterium]|nr:tetratricopeptide repeat protein [Candidatus Hydrogenedentota bacterium]